jgi:hypothetical protein
MLKRTDAATRSLEGSAPGLRKLDRVSQRFLSLTAADEWCSAALARERRPHRRVGRCRAAASIASALRRMMRRPRSAAHSAG